MGKSHPSKMGQVDCCDNRKGDDDDNITIAEQGVTMETKSSSLVPRFEQHEYSDQQQAFCDKQSEKVKQKLARKRAPKKATQEPKKTAQEPAAKNTAQEP